VVAGGCRRRDRPGRHHRLADGEPPRPGVAGRDDGARQRWQALAHPVEIDAHLVRRGIPLLGRLGQRAQDHPLERRGHLGVQLGRRARRVLDVSHRDRHGESPSNGTRPVTISYSTTPTE
jgi:hypothetical protein